LPNKNKVRIKLLDPKDEETICERVIPTETTSTTTTTTTSKTQRQTTTSKIQRTRTTTKPSRPMSTTSPKSSNRTSVLSIPQVQSSSDKNYDEKPDEDGFTFKALVFLFSHF
jgi:hypothetical protein